MQHGGKNNYMQYNFHTQFSPTTVDSYKNAAIQETAFFLGNFVAPHPSCSGPDCRPGRKYSPYSLLQYVIKAGYMEVDGHLWVVDTNSRLQTTHYCGPEFDLQNRNIWWNLQLAGHPRKIVWHCSFAETHYVFWATSTYCKLQDLRTNELKD